MTSERSPKDMPKKYETRALLTNPDVRRMRSADCASDKPIMLHAAYWLMLKLRDAIPSTRPFASAFKAAMMEPRDGRQLAERDLPRPGAVWFSPEAALRGPWVSQ
jgi:hypothetical protein